MTRWEVDLVVVAAEISGSARLVRWLCWALVVLAIIGALVTIATALGFVFPDVGRIDDLVERLIAFRRNDINAFPIVALGAVATLGVFVIVALLGVALRPWAEATSLRDVMTTLFVIGGVIGVVSQLVNFAVDLGATFSYCDCGYKTEEVIAQDYALSVGWGIAMWLSVGATALVGVAISLAGRLIAFGATLRTLAYVIAIVVLFAVALRLLEPFVQLPNIRLGQIADLIVGIGAGILVPIWAVLLARRVGGATTEA
jgi:hypothetical protein